MYELSNFCGTTQESVVASILSVQSVQSSDTSKKAVMQALAEVELTWVDRALQEGRIEGRQEGEQAGMRQLLLLLLTQKFGELPEEFVKRLNAMTDPATFAQLSSQVLTAQHLSEITLPTLQEKPVVRRG